MSLLDQIRTLATMPQVNIDLMLGATAGNDPFYARVVREFYEKTRRRHPKFPLIRQFKYGVALCVLPDTADEYLGMIEASGRRNVKKALRLGYRFERIVYNEHLDAVGEIRRSADVRQGQVPDKLLNAPVEPCENPVSSTNVHDYPFFGILKDDKLVAYCDCMIAGEACMLEHMLGHAAHQSDGIIPLLFVSIVKYVKEHHPHVKYFTYGTYFGAGETMRRFKRKFGFVPHRVEWGISFIGD